MTARVLLVIDDLRRAGAQRVITQDVRALHPGHVEFGVAALARTCEPGFEPELRKWEVGIDYLPGDGLRDLRRVIALRHVIESFAPNLVHTHLTYANILGSLAATIAHRPLVASLHNVDSNQSSWAPAKRRLEGLLLRNRATRIIVVSPSMLSATTRNFEVPPSRTMVVPNAVHPDSIRLPNGFNRSQKRMALGARPGEHLLCSVARLDASKGQSYLLRAIADVREREPALRIRVLLVGSGPDAASLRATATRLGLSSRIALLGTRHDVAEIIAASDLFVLPSLNEGLSQALLEAMSLSTPVVATDVGGTPDVVEPGRTGWRVPSGQPGALADAIQQALANPRIAGAYAYAAHALVERQFNFELHLARLQAVYACAATGQ